LLIAPKGDIMDNIFGLSMTTIMIVVLVIMGLCLLTTAIIALRNRVIFKMAIRNVPRRKAQTVLIMVGLMLATLIIAASLTTGDTLDYSIKSASYKGLGQTDETISFVGDTGGEGQISVVNVPFDQTIADQLEQKIADNSDIQGIMPMLTIEAPVLNQDGSRAESVVTITGIDPARLGGFGGLPNVDGGTIDPGVLTPGSGVLSEDLAKSINAKVGDTVTLYYRDQAQTLKVAGIAKPSLLTGVSVTQDSADLLGIAVPMDWMQQLTGLQGKVRFIAVSNTGGIESGAKATDDVMPVLRSALDGIQGGNQLGVNPIKKDAIHGAELAGNAFMGIFTMLGMFSVIAGILLIFLIFMMLAAERRAEMGMARAVGMKRRHLIQSFISEGTVYDLGAALLGAAAGVGVAFAIAGVMGQLLGDFIAITPHASLRSLVVAYALGVAVTFLTIIFASFRSSRLNIVQAIRDLPEHTVKQDIRPKLNWKPLRGIRAPFTLVANIFRVVWLPVRLFFYYVGWGPVTAVLGGLMMLLGADQKSIFWYSVGLSLLVLGIALFLRRFLPQRLVFTVAAVLMLAFWLLPFGTLDWLFPDLGTGGIEMFFVSGIFLVLYATLILMWNAEVIVWIVSLFGRTFSRWMPAVKTAVAYPLASKGRTGMTIAMFSLVIFSLVTITTINENFAALFSTDEAAAGWDLRVVTNPNNPVDDLKASLQGTKTDPNKIEATADLSTISTFNSQVRNPGADEWKQYTINGMSPEFIQNSEISLQSRAEGYATDADVWKALQENPNLAVVDAFALTSDDFGGDPDAYAIPKDITEKDGVIPQSPVELENGRDGKQATVTIIGIIDSKVSTLSGIYMSQQAFTDLYGAPDVNTIYVKMTGNPSASAADDYASSIEAALIQKGVQASSIQSDIDKGMAIQNGFMKLLQGFMGLGLLVGIAALGVISFRSVVERRQQIGMLRAIGYRSNMVAASFLLESLVIAALGVLSGTVMALVLSYNLVNSDDFSEGVDMGGFVTPWGTVIFFIVASLLAAALMTWIPARKASSVPIAEALRYE
jgi:putative ABC transport system permease protein